MVYESEVTGGVLGISALGGAYGASIEDSDYVMSKVIDSLVANRSIISIVLKETREHEYDEAQTKMLNGIADVIIEIIRERKLISLKNMGPRACEKLQDKWFAWASNLVTTQLRGDPVGAYVNIAREIRHVQILQKTASEKERTCMQHYLEGILFPLEAILKKTELIQKIEPDLSGYHPGDRSIYRKIFHPLTRPNFMLTKFTTKPPSGEIIDKYSVGDISVEIFKTPEKVRPTYFLMPPEFKLTEEEYIILDDARRTLEQRRPVELEMRDQTKIRELFYSIGVELIRDLAEIRKYQFTQDQINKLATILTRYTAGFGIIELLLADNKIEDINMNSPMGRIPIFIKHKDYEECETNLIPTLGDGERLATRFKLLSGRPLDEANPVLDTEIIVPEGVARVAAIGPRLSPEGLAFALRKHRFKPWTFPLFINEKMFDPLFGGLLWFMATYGRTVLIAGTRGSGKTSLLGSLMLQVIPYYRVLTVEDTFELPVDSLRNLGYNIERLKSRSVITRVELELSAEEALRTALRLGDSCLYIGEVRSIEAKALYEAMRIGALANVVAGTIHGDSAYGVFDRVVNDLGVPATSFKSTDLVVVANKLRTADGLRSYRRVTEVTEVRKHWQVDPVEERGFVNLFEYSAKQGKLMPTDTLVNGESILLNEIARRVPEWSGRWDAVWENINLRAKILETIVSIANQTGKKQLMEAETVVKSNEAFHEISEKVRMDVGEVNSQMVFSSWENWFKNYAKRVA